MCIVSKMYDDFSQRWTPTPATPFPYPLPTPAELDEFRRLLEKARKWDEEHGEPDCGTEEKRLKIQELADELGIEIDFI